MAGFEMGKESVAGRSDAVSRGQTAVEGKQYIPVVGQSVTIGLLTVMDALPPYAMRGTCKSGGRSHRVSLRRTEDTEEKGFDTRVYI